MNPTNPDPAPTRTDATDAARRIVRRALVEAHDVYVPEESPVTAALRDECLALYRELRFDAGIARARRDEGWTRDPDARLYVAIGLHYQRRYDEAREEYRQAGALSDDASFRGTCAANVGTVWYEQGEFDRALEMYREALEIDPRNEFALAGVLGVGCHRRDVAAVLRAAAALRAAWPAWAERPVLAAMFRKDRSFRFLREEPGLFERALGAPIAASVG